MIKLKLVRLFINKWYYNNSHYYNNKQKKYYPIERKNVRRLREA